MKVLLLLLATAAAWGHDVTVWPDQDGKDVKLRFHYGDPGDYQPIDKVRFAELAVFDPKGVRFNFLRDIERGADSKVVGTQKLRLGDWPAGTYVVSARYDNGLYVHDTENRAIATSREWFPDAIDSAHYQKFSKALFHVGPPGAGFDRVAGHRLEFIPRGDPFAAKPGTALPVELQFDGKPLPDHLVELGDDTAASKGPELRTDGKGTVLVPLDRDGAYRLAADHRVKSRFPDLFLDDDYTASLVFVRR
jgi:uncharacterized GH25 family protein